MRVLGTVASHKPVNLPSLKKENAGLDPSVRLVSGRSGGWGGKATAKEAPEPARNGTENAEKKPSGGVVDSSASVAKKSNNNKAWSDAEAANANPQTMHRTRDVHLSTKDFPSLKGGTDDIYNGKDTAQCSFFVHANVLRGR